MYIYIYICTCICIYTYIYTYIYIYICVCRSPNARLPLEVLHFYSFFTIHFIEVLVVF